MELAPKQTQHRVSPIKRKELSRRIKLKMSEAILSQKELMGMTNLSQAQISQAVSGNGYVSEMCYRNICRALKIPYDIQEENLNELNRKAWDAAITEMKKRYKKEKMLLRLLKILDILWWIITILTVAILISIHFSK
jgi:transcriptional regulator with XRE-family HTH domain